MDELCARVDAALGKNPADLVIKNARLLDLNTGKTTLTDIAVRGNVIVGTYGTFKGKKEINARGLTAVPGFIDAHAHVESSMVTPFEFERCVLPRGTVTVVCDPHELANVCGADALDYFLSCAEKMKMDLYVQASACVPSTPLETSGAALYAKDLKTAAAHPKNLGLAEFMNVPGLLNKEADALEKIRLFDGKLLDGHAPLLSGAELNAYLSCGVSNDHEVSSLPEAQEKLAKGMNVFIREGGVAKNLRALAPLVKDEYLPFLAFCTDDRTPLDVKREGHLDHLIAQAIRLGAKPHTAYKTASYSAAVCLGLKRTGLIAPGYKADIVLLSDVKKCRVARVVKNGRLVNARLFKERGEEPSAAFALNSFKRGPVSVKDLRVPAARAGEPVIGVTENSLITQKLYKKAPVKNGELTADPAKDLLKMAVIGRHTRGGKVSCAFVHGFGLKTGALASSVAHDSHNISVIGANDADMARAANEVRRQRGGFCAVKNGKVLARMPLEIGGLMTRAPFAQAARRIEKMKAAARKLGCPLHEPMLQLAFLQLPVIPHLKLTDLGLVDADAFTFIGGRGA